MNINKYVMKGESGIVLMKKKRCKSIELKRERDGEISLSEMQEKEIRDRVIYIYNRILNKKIFLD